MNKSADNLADGDNGSEPGDGSESSIASIFEKDDDLSDSDEELPKPGQKRNFS